MFLCYLVGLSRWCGALRVKSSVFEDDTPVFADPDPYTIRFTVEPIYAFDQETAVPLFLDRLWNGLSLTREIPKGAPGWAVNFRGSLRSISKEDGELVLAELAQQDAERRPFALSERDKRQLARRASLPSDKGTVVVEVPDATEEEEEAPTSVTNTQTHDGEDIRASLKIQASLAQLGGTLGFKIWIAPGDRRKVREQENVRPDLLLENCRSTMAARQWGRLSRSM